MPREPKIDYSWMPKAAELMVTEGITLKEAVTALSVPLTSDECLTLQRRKSFKDLVRGARNRLHNEIGTDPARTKDAVIGQMQIQADNLEKSGEYEKAAEVLFKIAKVRNWIGETGTVNIFGDLTAKDFEAIRKRLAEREAAQKTGVN